MHLKQLAGGIAISAVVMAFNLVAGIIVLGLVVLAGVGVTIRSWYRKDGHGEQLRLKQEQVDELQVTTAMKVFGVPRDVAIQTLPKQDLASNLFGKHPMGNLKPVFDWLRVNNPEKYAMISKEDIAHFA